MKRRKKAVNLTIGASRWKSKAIPRFDLYFPDWRIFWEPQKNRHSGVFLRQFVKAWFNDGLRYYAIIMAMYSCIVGISKGFLRGPF